MTAGTTAAAAMFGWDSISLAGMACGVIACCGTVLSRPREGAPGPLPLAALAFSGASQAALACAVHPLAFATAWQLQWTLLYAAALGGGPTEQLEARGRALVLSWLVDGPILAAALLLKFAEAGDPRFPAVQATLCTGLAWSIANRAGLLPLGVIRRWGDVPVHPFLAEARLWIVPSVAVAAMRLGSWLEGGEQRLEIAQTLLMVSLLAGWTSVAQEAAVRRTAWATAALLGGITAIGLTMPVSWSICLWLAVAVAFQVPQVQALVTMPSGRRPVEPPRSWADAVHLMAAEEWGVPRLLRFCIEMPMRGASLVTRFVDGFVFEQLPRRAASRLLLPLERITERAGPEAPLRVGLALFGIAIVLLFVRAFR